MNTSRLSVNIKIPKVADWTAMVDFLSQLEPTILVACIDSLNDKGHIFDLKQALPNTRIVARFIDQVHDGGYHTQPHDERRWLVSPTDFMNAYQELGQNGLSLYTMNEPSGEIKGDVIPRLVDWMIETINLATQRNVSLTVMNWGVGHPLLNTNNDQWEDRFDRVLQLLSQTRDRHFLGLHFYEPADIFRRFDAMLARCKVLNITPPRVILTEFGFDAASGTDQRNGYKTRGLSGKEFADWQIDKINTVYRPYIQNDILKGVCTFIWGDEVSWPSFNVENDTDWRDTILAAKNAGQLSIESTTIHPAPIPESGGAVGMQSLIQSQAVPQTPPRPSSVPQTRSAGMLQLGLNFNPDGPTGQPNDAKVLQGVKWGRMVFMADDMRRSVDQAFGFYDSIVAQYNAAGVGVLFVINHQTLKGNTPWVSGGGWSDYTQQYAQVCGQIAAHYADKNVAFEIWNEQDFGDASTHIPGGEYGRILEAAYKAIKSVSTALVVMGGMASAPLDVVRYVQAAKGAVSGKFPADAIGLHPYGQWTPNFTQKPEWGGWHAPLADYLKDVVPALPKLPIWITEAGVSENVHIPTEQYPMVMNYMQGLYDIAQTRYADRIGAIIWFAWSDTMRQAGIVDESNTPKPDIYQKFFSLVTAANKAAQRADVIQSAPRVTPYDGTIAWWHWKGLSVVENTIEELLASIKIKTPNVTSIFVKTNQGAQWIGTSDNTPKPDLKVGSVEDVKRWVKKCNDAGFDFHAWCVVTGNFPDAEIALMADICNVPGVKSLILDVEEGKDYYQGGPQIAQRIGTELRQRIPDGFHLGLCLDARGNHPRDNFIGKWLPSIDSLHPMCYHVTFQLDPDETVNIALNAFEQYGLPVIPALQAGHATHASEITTAANTALHGTLRVRPLGISFWRYGLAGVEPISKPEDFAAISAISMPDVKPHHIDDQSIAQHTNQDVINAFADAAKSLNDPNYWAWVISADLTYLASDRTRAYGGPAIAALPGLSAEQKNLIQRALDGLPLDAPTVMSTSSTIGKYTNRQIIVAFAEAARLANERDAYFQWLSAAGLQDTMQDQPAIFQGPEISVLPNLTDEQKRSIITLLQAMPFEASVVGKIRLEVPWITQMDARGRGNHDCGQACVLMLLHYHNLALNKKLSDIAKMVDLEEDGTTPGNLQWLAGQFGLSLTIDTDLTDANGCVTPLTNKRPVILLVNYADLGFPVHLQTGIDQGPHWLVVVGHEDAGNFLVHDPLWTDPTGNQPGAFRTITYDVLTDAMKKSGTRYQALY